MVDGQGEVNGYQFSLVEIDGTDYPQLSQPIDHELLFFPSFRFPSYFMHCSSAVRSIDG